VTAEINKDGGIFIKELGKKLPIRIKAMDTESNPTKAAEVASKLILQDKVDLMVVCTLRIRSIRSGYVRKTRGPMHLFGGSIEPWLTGGPYKWTFPSSGIWGRSSTSSRGCGTASPTKRASSGGFWPNDPDGAVWAQEFGKELNAMGYRVVDVGRFPYGMQDFGAFIST